jgi:hypothetical protein
VKPGEESRDLSSIQPDSNSSSQNPSDEVKTQPDTSIAENPPQEELHEPPDALYTNKEQPQAVGQLDLGGNEWPMLDMFGSLLDSDMTSLLPMGENVDFSFLNTDVMAWGLGDEFQEV